MANQKLSDKKYDGIAADATIDLKVQGDFYSELKAVFNRFLMEDESKESMATIIDHLIEGRIHTVKEHRLYIMYLMLVKIESEAKAQGKLTKMTVDEALSQWSPQS